MGKIKSNEPAQAKGLGLYEYRWTGVYRGLGYEYMTTGGLGFAEDWDMSI